ncbi:MAG: hypothetical protein ACLR0U_16740 [Enterocloster clostridioformis]
MMSEIWADPDAEGQKENGRRIKMLFKFHIRELGRFDMILALSGPAGEMQLYVPPSLAEKAETIQGGIAEILEKWNGFKPAAGAGEDRRHKTGSYISGDSRKGEGH